MSYQKVTGCLSQGAHPGSYNGQDAYNDMLVTDGVFNSEDRRVQTVAESIDIERERLQERDRPCGQRERVVIVWTIMQKGVML